MSVIDQEIFAQRIAADTHTAAAASLFALLAVRALLHALLRTMHCHLLTRPADEHLSEAEHGRGHAGAGLGVRGSAVARPLRWPRASPAASTWRSDKGKVAAAVEHALKHGYVHLDCAAVYANQEEVGEGLRASGVPRERVFITSKLWNTEHAAADVRPALEQTLRELGVEQLDLYLVHWPVPFAKSDAAFPRHPDGSSMQGTATLRETWQAMEACVDAGLTKAIGVSNFSIEEIQQVLSFARIRPAVNQVELQPYFNQEELSAFCQREGIVITSYCPLGNLNPQDASQVTPLQDEVVRSIAEAHGKTPAQVLIRWNIQLGNVVIPKSVTPSRIEENAQVFDFELTPSEMAQLNGLGARKRRFVNPKFRAGGAPVFPE